MIAALTADMKNGNLEHRKDLHKDFKQNGNLEHRKDLHNDLNGNPKIFQEGLSKTPRLLKRFPKL